MKTRPASPTDFLRILALNAGQVQHTSAMDLPHLQFLHAQSCWHQVAEVDGVVAAFLLVFRDGAAYPNPNFDWFAARYPSFVYVDRVVVDAALHGRGLGALLYRELFEHARNLGVPLVTCEFNVVPPNLVSAAFHARFGFGEVGRQWLDQGRKQVSMQAARLAGS